MLNKSSFKPWQREVIQMQVEHPRSMLWLFMGAGKTAISLTSIQHLQKHRAIRGALVIGPRRVIQSGWEKEALKWEHLRSMRFSLMHGSPDRRLSALMSKADVYLINYEGIPWLSSVLETYFSDRPLPFDMLVLDEITRMKNADTVRFQHLLPWLPHFDYRTGLTGTPSPNGLQDIHGQYLMIDDGVRLGPDPDTFLNSYFDKVGYGGYSYAVSPASEKIIHSAVADITVEMSQKDYLALPKFSTHRIVVDLPPAARKKYDNLENLFFAELDSGLELEVESEVAKINKLLQFSNGAVYTDTESKDWERVHDAKLEALDEIIEEASGQPILLGYLYRTDAARILQRYKYAVDLSRPGMSKADFEQALEDFQAGKLRLLIGHPGSMGHGVDGLQHGGHILVWYGLPWSLEQFLQMEARIQRQGQTHPVQCYRILCRDTMDQVVEDKLTWKQDSQDALRAAVNAYRRAKGMGEPQVAFGR